MLFYLVCMLLFIVGECCFGWEYVFDELLIVFLWNKLMIKGVF